jgi:hypothetical protein
MYDDDVIIDDGCYGYDVLAQLTHRFTSSFLVYDALLRLVSFIHALPRVMVSLHFVCCDAMYIVFLVKLSARCFILRLVSVGALWPPCYTSLAY